MNVAKPGPFFLISLPPSTPMEASLEAWIVENILNVLQEGEGGRNIYDRLSTRFSAIRESSGAQTSAESVA